MGRPTKLTPDAQAQILKAITAGATRVEFDRAKADNVLKLICMGVDVERSCRVVGLDFEIFKSWLALGEIDESPIQYRALLSKFFYAAAYTADAYHAVIFRHSARDVHGVGYVYFLRDSILGKTKIGHAASDVQARIGQLQAGCPQTLELIAIIESDDANRLEMKLHRDFARYRYRGEWFSLTDEDLDSILSRYGGKRVSGELWLGQRN